MNIGELDFTLAVIWSVFAAIFIAITCSVVPHLAFGTERTRVLGFKKIGVKVVVPYWYRLYALFLVLYLGLSFMVLGLVVYSGLYSLFGVIIGIVMAYFGPRTLLVK